MSCTGVEGLEVLEGDDGAEVRCVGVVGRLLSADCERLGKDGGVERPIRLTVGDGHRWDVAGMTGDVVLGVPDLFLDVTSLVRGLRATGAALFF